MTPEVPDEYVLLARCIVVSWWVDDFVSPFWFFQEAMDLKFPKPPKNMRKPCPEEDPNE